MITLRPAKEESPDRAGTKLFAEQSEQVKNIVDTADSVRSKVEQNMELFADICGQLSHKLSTAGVPVTPRAQVEEAATQKPGSGAGSTGPT